MSDKAQAVVAVGERRRGGSAKVGVPQKLAVHGHRLTQRGPPASLCRRGPRGLTWQSEKAFRQKTAEKIDAPKSIARWLLAATVPSATTRHASTTTPLTAKRPRASPTAEAAAAMDEDVRNLLSVRYQAKVCILSLSSPSGTNASCKYDHPHGRAMDGGGSDGGGGVCNMPGCSLAMPSVGQACAGGVRPPFPVNHLPFRRLHSLPPHSFVCPDDIDPGACHCSPCAVHKNSKCGVARPLHL